MGFFGKLPKPGINLTKGIDLTKKSGFSGGIDLRKTPPISIDENFNKKPKVKKRFGSFELPDFEEGQDDLERFGDTPFFTTPWTDRPADYDEPFTNTALGLETAIVADGCNFGGQINGAILFFKLPIFQFVWRNPNCQDPPAPPTEVQVGDAACVSVNCKDGTVITTARSNADDIFIPSPRLIFSNNADSQVVATAEYNRSIKIMKQIIDDASKFPSITNVRVTTDNALAKSARQAGIQYNGDGFQPHVASEKRFKIAVTRGENVTFSEDKIEKTSGGDYISEHIEYSIRFFRVEYNYAPNYPSEAGKYHVDQQAGTWLVTRFKNPVCEIAKPAPPPPKQEECDCMSCCPKIDDTLLKLILKRLGNLPASVPDNFTKQHPTFVNIESLAELMLWQMQQLDALMGAYPIEIKIEDNDLTKEGNQEQKITVPNAAEAMAELLGLILTIKRDTHATLITAIKAMAEAGMSKNVSIKTLDVALANAEFLGYKLEQKEKEVPSLFTPGGKDITETLKEKNVKIITYENTDSKDIQGDLKTLLTMASRWNAQNWRSLGNADPVEALKDHLFGKNDAIKTAAEPNKQDDFDTFTEQCERGFTEVSGITDTTNPWGKPYTERPKIREIGSEAGRYNADGTPKEHK